MKAGHPHHEKRGGKAGKGKMQILSATECAIRTVLCLSLAGQGRKVTGQEICRTQDITPAFLIKITRPLIESGLVSAVRGVGGGFMLAKPPESISLLDVIRVMQGPPVFNECLLGPGTCSRDRFCPVHPVWKQVRAQTEATLQEWSMADLAREARANLNLPPRDHASPRPGEPEEGI